MVECLDSRPSLSDIYINICLYIINVLMSLICTCFRAPDRTTLGEQVCFSFYFVHQCVPWPKSIPKSRPFLTLHYLNNQIISKFLYLPEFFGLRKWKRPLHLHKAHVLIAVKIYGINWRRRAICSHFPFISAVKQSLLFTLQRFLDLLCTIFNCEG